MCSTNISGGGEGGRIGHASKKVDMDGAFGCHGHIRPSTHLVEGEDVERIVPAGRNLVIHRFSHCTHIAAIAFGIAGKRQ